MCADANWFQCSSKLSAGQGQNQFSLKFCEVRSSSSVRATNPGKPLNQSQRARAMEPAPASHSPRAPLPLSPPFPSVSPFSFPSRLPRSAVGKPPPVFSLPLRRPAPPLSYSAHTTSFALLRPPFPHYRPSPSLKKFNPTAPAGGPCVVQINE